MRQERIFQAVDNGSFHLVVQLYSFYKGRLILTEGDQHAALLNYINIAKTLN